jgi:predicted amino acid racemase
MFLDAVTRRNPALVDAALDMHAHGLIPPGSFVIDLDAVEDNARLLADAAAAEGLTLYFMTKQVGRNPFVAERAARHIASAVAVDLDDAAGLARAGVPIGHIGHLVQPHERAFDRVVAYEPEVVTVFSVDKARGLSAAAEHAGREQRVLLRVAAQGDFFYPGQEGGIPLSELERARAAIDAMPGLRVGGVTTYPAVEFADGGFRATPNLGTLARAAELLEDLDQVNAPGHSSVAVFPLLRAAPVTHAEPGHALTGTTPLAARADTTEMPAILYLTEVSHVGSEGIAVFGGGFYSRGHADFGLLVHHGRRRRLPLHPIGPDAIDYYRHLVGDGGPAAVGDAAIFAFRFQIFTSRARVATVAGLSSGRPRLAGIHDAYGRPVDGLTGVDPAARQVAQAHASDEAAP